MGGRGGGEARSSDRVAVFCGQRKLGVGAVALAASVALSEPIGHRGHRRRGKKGAMREKGVRKREKMDNVWGST